MIRLPDCKHEITLTHDSPKIKVYEIINYEDDEWGKSYYGEDKVITMSLEDNKWVVRLIEGNVWGSSMDEVRRNIIVKPLNIDIKNYESPKAAVEAYLCSLKI